MEFRLDRSKTYALALEGGGGRGAYEIGAWKALTDEGLKFCAVSGTSVGAINGAAIVSGSISKAIEMWRSITYSQVMQVNDSIMNKLIRLDIHGIDIRKTAKTLTETLKNRGFDITPLKATLQEAIDEKEVMDSPMEFYIVTFSIDDRKGLVVRAKDLAKGELYDMLLASAYLPVFRSERLGGKRYFDGGLSNRLPISPLVERGYTDIIAVELNSIGPIQKYDYPGVEVHSIKPVSDLGGLIQFEAKLSERNLRLGYYDAVKMMYGLSGHTYYIDRKMTDEDAYSLLLRFTTEFEKAAGNPCDRRTVNERYLPALASRLKVPRSDGYYELFLAALESAADSAGIDPFAVRSEHDLLSKVLKVYDPAAGRIPRSFVRTLPSIQKR